MSASKDIVATQKTWFIFPETNHAGYVEAGQNISSVHPVELFDNEAEWQARKDELGIEDESDVEDEE